MSSYSLDHYVQAKGQNCMHPLTLAYLELECLFTSKRFSAVRSGQFHFIYSYSWSLKHSVVTEVSVIAGPRYYFNLLKAAEWAFTTVFFTSYLAGHISASFLHQKKDIGATRR